MNELRTRNALNLILNVLFPLVVCFAQKSEYAKIEIKCRSKSS